MKKQKKQLTPEQKAEKKAQREAKIKDDIAKEFIEALTADGLPWCKPWNTEGSSGWPKNPTTNKGYQGSNFVRLGWRTHLRRYSTNLWCGVSQIQNYRTKEAKEANEKLTPRKGERCTYVAVPQPWEEKDDAGQVTKSGMFFSYKPIFNVDQFNQDLLDRASLVPQVKKFKPLTETERNTKAEKIVKKYIKITKIPLTFSGDRAFYKPAMDSITMPKFQEFKNGPSYYSTLFHECIHSTGHESRLNRSGIVELNAFGSHEYTKEELVAELGASLLCGHCGFKDYVVENQKAYVKGWLERLESDPEWIVKASKDAFDGMQKVLGQELNK